VIDAFVASWPLFRDTDLAGAAISQASTLGIAALLWVEGLGAGAAVFGVDAHGAAALCAIAASVTTALAATRPSAGTAEASNAWVFLLAAGVPVLLLAHSPLGLEEVHRLMFSTLLGATPHDVAPFGALALGAALAAAAFAAPLLLLATDPEMAAAAGLRRARWERAVAIALGVAIGESIHVAGLIYTFGCLVLPALAARNLCRETRGVLLLAPLLGVATAALAFVVANAWDVPPAHTTVAGLCALVAGSWAVRRR
jgi:manganese/iron transport system permease protein